MSDEPEEKPEDQVALPWDHPEAIAATAEAKARRAAYIAELVKGSERPSTVEDDEANTALSVSFVRMHHERLADRYPGAYIRTPPHVTGVREELGELTVQPFGGPRELDENSFWSPDNWPGVSLENLALARKLWEEGSNPDPTKESP